MQTADVKSSSEEELPQSGGGIFYSLPLEGKVDFSALPKKTDEVFLRRPPM
ncbi:MAG: hypothetical protein IJA17_00210 [Oscillospiraceae bacterium]|nr:hypothetical protein [Oscillospiraceae bacterium]